MCGFYDVSVAKFGESTNLITRAENFGVQEDVFDGFDFTLNARLPNRVFLSGGLSLGRQRTNTCYMWTIAACSFTPTAPAHEAVLRRSAAHAAERKASGRVPVALVGRPDLPRRSRACPGPQLLAQQNTSNAQSGHSLGRNLSSCGATAVATAGSCWTSCRRDAVRRAPQPGRPPVQQDDADRPDSVRPTVSVYNLLNANTVCSTTIATRPVAGAHGHPDRAIRGLRRAGGFLRLVRRKLATRYQRRRAAGQFRSTETGGGGGSGDTLTRKRWPFRAGA